MKRRIILITVIVVVLAGLGRGIHWYVSRRGGRDYLVRADLAIKAGNFRKGANLARRYTIRHPDDWRGYYVHARALMGVGRYGDARKPLKEASRRFPDRVAISLSLADTYSIPARKAVSSKLAGKNRDMFRKAIKDLGHAQDILDDARKRISADKITEVENGLSLLEQVGLNRMRTGGAYALLSRSLAEAGKTARASRQVDLADMMLALSESASAVVESNTAAAEAVETLLAAARIDASRDSAARPLVRIAIDCQDINPHDDLRRITFGFPADLRKITAAPEGELRRILADLARDDAEADTGSEDDLGKIVAGMSEEDRKALAGAHDDVRKLLAPLSVEDREVVAKSHGELRTIIAALRALDKVRRIVVGLDEESRKALAASPEDLRRVVAALDDGPRRIIVASLNHYHKIVASWLAIHEVRSILAKAKDPAPVATAILLMTDLKALRGRVDTKTFEAKLAETAGRLDDILSRHPGVVRVRLARSDVALQSDDPATARKHCDRLIKTESRNPRIRLLNARLLDLEGHPKRSMDELFSLTASFPKWVPGHIAFARAAYRMADTGHMEQAMRRVTELVPGHPEACRFLAEYLHARGFYQEAFDDAKAYHDAHPDDSTAVRLFAMTAARTNGKDEARKLLARAESDHATRLDMMIAVAIGYDAVGDKAEAMRVAKRIAEHKPTSPGEQTSVARAMVFVGRRREAETLLADELKRDPSQHELAFELAGLFARTGRVTLALKHYRSAVKLRPHDERYRLVLAGVQLDNGDLAECEQTLTGVSSDNMQGNLLRLQIKLLRGQSVDAQEMIQRAQRAGRSGLPLAMSYLNHGRPDECIRMCEVELEKRPNDVNAQSLLGEAYLVLGKIDKTVEQWTEVLEASPERLPGYLRLAAVMSMREAPEQVAYHLSHIPVARDSLVDMAMGWLWSRRGDSVRAALFYGRVANRASVPEYIRGQAALLGAKSLAMAGRPELAIQALDKLAAVEGWRNRALLGKAQALAAAGKIDQADKTLRALVKLAVAEEDVTALQGVVALYVRIRKAPLALAACRQIRQIMPRDARSHILTAGVFVADGQLDKAIEWYRKAVETQPGNIRAHLALAKATDAAEGPLAALAVLAETERMGGRGKAVSVFEQGRMFARWGLHKQAVERFEQLRAGGHGRDPAIQLVLGRAFLMSGKRPQAASVLAEIPQHANQYIAAQRLLAELTEDTKERLKILKALSQTGRGARSAPIQEMSALIRSERADEAVKLFETFLHETSDSGPAPTAVAALAFRAMLQAGDLTGAADLSLRMHKETRLPTWRSLAVLLTVDDRPAIAAGLIGAADPDSMTDVLTGLVAAGQRGDTGSAKKWLAQLQRIDQELAAGGVARRVPAEYKCLAALAAGDVASAQKGLAALKGRSLVVMPAVAELVASAGREGAVREAVGLLKASLAMEVGLRGKGSRWALAALKTRPTCQWAAVVLYMQGSDTATDEQIAQMLQPPDCLIAGMIRARLHMRQRKYLQAAELYARLAASREGDVELTMNHAQAMEEAGKLPEALELYRRALLVGKDVRAANNVAYLTTLVHPSDKKRLGEAYELAKTTLKSFPRSAVLRDTAGWVAHLLGKHDEAVRDLRLAVKALPDAPEVHYHLGTAEAAAGRNKIARWHLSAAMDIGQMMKEKKQYIGPQTAEAIQLATMALDRLP